MKTVRYCSTMLLLSMALAGCGGDDSASFSLLADSDEFFQDANSANSISKIDILWVIDNSGSMQTSQDNVAANFQAFITDFASKNIDYEIAVTTTEAYRSLFTTNTSWSRFRDGNATSGPTGYRIITPSTPNIEDVFIDNILQGVSGTGDERAFSSFEAALANADNAGFVRQNSFLSVIIVSDEDDFSSSSSTFREDYNHSTIYPISRFVDILSVATGSTSLRRRFAVSAMAIFDEPCRVSLNNSFTGRKIGQRYAQLVDATGGVKGSLCGNFANELKAITTNILQLATQFFLSRVPVESTIVVRINGQEVPKAGQGTNGGWQYEAATNSIIFSGDYIPPAGAAIKVDFDPVQYGG